MNLPPPTERQARILWNSLTALAIGILVALAALIALGMGWCIDKLSGVLLPLAIAAVVAYLLDPLVDFFIKRGISRMGSILIVFFVALLALGLFLATVVPRLIVETQGLIRHSKSYMEQLQSSIDQMIQHPPGALHLPASWRRWIPSPSAPPSKPRLATNPPSITLTNLTQPPSPALSPTNAPPAPFWQSQLGESLISWAAQFFPKAGRWFLNQLTKVASWAGLLAGLALVPVYVFYFLLEKRGIEDKWTDYLPLRESRAKEELVFVLTSINDYLILFFRGQVLVALCDGVLLSIGFFLVGLPYGLLLGVIAGFLSIVPYLGVMLSILPTTILAAIQYGDWLHPLFVIIVFAVVQSAEGLFISPKIMGDRVGLHPLTIIIAVLIGTTLMGGILGGVLAIPLTAALRVLMFRYVWKKETRRRRKRRNHPNPSLPPA